MSDDLRDEMKQLLSDDESRMEYKHEITISAFTNGIARIMSDQGVSQSELARRLGVSRARVSQLMQHRSSPTLRTMVQVASALGHDVVPVIAPSAAGVSDLLPILSSDA